MALYTSLSLDDARPIAQAYGFDVQSITPLIAGSVNSNFSLDVTRRDEGEGSKKKIFARIYEEQDDLGAHDEAALLDWLFERGVPLARPFRRPDGSAISRFGSRPVAMFPWVEGEIRCTASVTPNDMRIVGETLANIHQAGMPSMRESRFSLDRLVERTSQIDAADAPELRAMAPVLRERLAEVRAAREPGCSRGLCHGDLFRDNVLWREWADRYRARLRKRGARCVDVRSRDHHDGLVFSGRFCPRASARAGSGLHVGAHAHERRPRRSVHRSATRSTSFYDHANHRLRDARGLWCQRVS
ncbi:MAG: phosphotransferase [Polyangiaceae bacterium]